ncbi:MAG: septum formation initiator family protein [Chloroflexi bacterium]|nr:septum formation initiator family protein [Chloroflexota bacterium]
MTNLFRYTRTGPRLIALFLLPVVVYGFYSIGDRWYQNYVLTHQEEMIRADVRRLREENLRLQKELNEARSDAGIERVAREQLGLVKPGDTAVQIVLPQGAAAAAVQPAVRAPEPAQTMTPPEKPAWLRFLDGLFGR